MAPTLDLTPDELLSTTRSVRKRLDLDRPVEPEVIRECIELATQAPTGGNTQGWHFVVIDDADKRAKLAELYKTGWDVFYGDPEAAIANMSQDDPDFLQVQRRVLGSADYLANHLAEVPVHVIPCIDGRLDQAPAMVQASMWGSLIPAVWNFCLAARARGLGTCFTTLHLVREPEAAELLGIPDHVQQGALIPVAYTKGTDFKPGPRRDLDRIVHVNGW